MEITADYTVASEVNFNYRQLVVILGVPVDVLTMDQSLDQIEDFVVRGRRTGRTFQVSTVNVDFVVNALRDPETRFILQETDLATADGMPITWGAKLLGVPISERVAGADMVPLLAERAAKKGFSIFFLGAGPGIATQAAEILKNKYPELRIAGVYSPPFGSILEMDDNFIKHIKAAKPDILLVAFGNPKQEKWIAMNRYELGVPVMIGVGGTLDFITKNFVRAPKWMQKLGLEWLHRLAQDPGRLWKRYVSDFFIFGSLFLRQWWQVRMNENTSPIVPNEGTLIINNTGILRTHHKITIKDLSDFNKEICQLVAKTSRIVLDMTRTDFIDSAAVGSLVHLAKEIQLRGKKFYLASISKNVHKTLELLKLDKYFLIFDTVDQVFSNSPGHDNSSDREDISNMRDHLGIKLENVISIPRRFDAQTAEQVQTECHLQLQNDTTLVLDFSNTVFLASAGLAVLASLNQQIEESGGKLILHGVNQDVHRVLELVRFDQFLLINPKDSSRLVDL